MRAYLSVWRLRFLQGMQYRTAALAGIATQLFFGLVFIMVYVAFYEQGSSGSNFPLQDLVSYVWLQQMFLTFIMLWFRDNEIFELITTGNIAYELCRPCGLYPFWFAKLIGQRLSSAALRCWPILAIVLFLPRPYRLSPPPSLAALALFAASLLVGLFVVVSVSMLLHLSVFWTLSPTGSTLMVSVAGEFFAGTVIPVPLMPAWLQRVCDFLPFRWAADFPFRVYSGQISTGEALWGIAAQLAWIAGLVAVGMLSLRRAMRRVVVQGG